MFNLVATVLLTVAIYINILELYIRTPHSYQHIPIHIQLSIGPMFFLRNESLVRDRPPIPPPLEMETFSTHLPDPI